MNQNSITMEPLDRSAMSLGPGCCLKSAAKDGHKNDSPGEEIGEHVAVEAALGPIGGIFAAIQMINEKVGDQNNVGKPQTGEIVRQSQSLDVAPPKMKATIADEQAAEAAAAARRRKLN